MASDGLSLLELCDVAYVLWLEQVRQEYLVDRQAFGVWALTSGNPEASPPLWEARKAEHDEWLASEGRPVEASMLEQLLGLAA